MRMAYVRVHSCRWLESPRGRFLRFCRSGFRSLGLDAFLHPRHELAPAPEDRSRRPRNAIQGEICAGEQREHRGYGETATHRDAPDLLPAGTGPATCAGCKPQARDQGPADQPEPCSGARDCSGLGKTGSLEMMIDPGARRKCRLALQQIDVGYPEGARIGQSAALKRTVENDGRMWL